MKTIHDAATERSIYYESNTYCDFTAGAKFAQQWISVKDELPEIKDKRYQIHVKYKSGIDIYDTFAIEPSICTKDNLYRILREFKIAYWRPIERKYYENPLLCNVRGL